MMLRRFALLAALTAASILTLAGGSAIAQPRLASGLATSAKAKKVMVYTMTGCGHCETTKAWLAQNGYQYSECNLSVKESCKDQFFALGGVGTPFLVVGRGSDRRLMRNGWNRSEFLSAVGS